MSVSNKPWLADRQPSVSVAGRSRGRPGGCRPAPASTRMDSHPKVPMSQISSAPDHRAPSVAPPLHLAIALDGAGWHPAAWREPAARPTELLTANYWADLALEAERGLLDF